MDKPITFRSSGLSGDLIAFLAGVKKVCEDNNTKAVIFMWLDREMFLYQGAEHPYGGKMFTQYAFDMMRPLMLAQSYIDDFVIWQGEEFLIDLDVHREHSIGMPYGSIHKWIGLMYPEMLADLLEPWIDFSSRDLPHLWDVHHPAHNKILINRTSRYHNHTVSYFFLEKYQDRMMFLGTPDEHKAFNEEWNLNIPHFKVKDFLELAIALWCCKFFIGNQSMCYNIAEAMKVPRLMEYCTFAPNVMAIGPNAYEYAWQSALIILFEKMDKQL